MANEEEKQNISRLEKQLGLKRRKSKNLPKSFTEDGLDYLINVSDSTKIEALGEDLSEEEDDEEFVKKMRLSRSTHPPAQAPTKVEVKSMTKAT